MSNTIVLYKILLGFVVVIVIIMLGRSVRKALQRIKSTGTTSRWIEAAQPYLIICFLASLFICVLFSTSYYYNDFLSDPVTVNASEVVPLFNVTFVATSIAFFVTQTGIFFLAYRYRMKPEGKASHIKQNPKLELTWTLLPAFVFIFLFLWGQVLWAKITGENSDNNVLQIEITGQQFSWLAHYSGNDKKLGNTDFRFMDNVNDIGLDTTDPNSQDDFIPVQLHIPKGRPVTLLLRSKDVIHSFYIPYFGIKMDAVPGMITYLNFTATMTTEEMRKKLKDREFDYEVACAELCGRMHFAMKLIVVVDEPGEFEIWSRQQPGWISKHKDEDIL